MRKKTTEEFILDAKKVHGDKYDYSKVEYTTNKDKVIILCRHCGYIFSQKPDAHVNGRGCAECAGVKKYNKDNYTNKCNIIHNNKYIYDKVVLNGINNKIIITCPIHGDFTQKASLHLTSKQGCLKCSHITPITKESFILKANRLHDGRYDYSSVMIDGNNKSKVNIICKKHGIFSQSINNHLRGQNCPSCSAVYKGESLIKQILLNNGIEYVTQKSFKGCNRIKPLRFDFYLPSKNICIEFDGVQHYKPVEKFGGEKRYKIQMEIDNIKNKYCEDNNIKLIRIPYSMLSMIDKKILDIYGC